MNASEPDGDRGNGTAAATAAGRIHRRIVTRHAEDAAFYWARRMEGSLASQHDLRSLGRFEFLLQANLEGLRVAQHESGTFGPEGQVMHPGNAGWAAAFRRVQLWKTADETFVAATLAMERAAAPVPDASGGAAPALELARLEEMACDQFDDDAGTAVTPIARGLASAAAWLPWDVAGNLVVAWARSPEPVLRRCALSALALHRLPVDDALAQWLQDPHPLARARALRAVGELGRSDLADELVAVLDAPASDDASCRAAAAHSLCLLGHPRGAAEGAAALTGLHGLVPAWTQAASATQLQTAIGSALQHREHWRLALGAIRFSGHARWLGTLIEMMEHESGAEPVARFFTEPAANLARQAADVFAHITGAQMSQQLWRDTPEPEDDADAAASDPRIPAARKQDPDDGLLWPDVDAIKQWWAAHGGAFADGGAHKGRYLAGQPLSASAAAAVLVAPAATQAQRHHAALHLRCAAYTAHLFDVRAPLPAQRARAAALGLVLP